MSDIASDLLSLLVCPLTRSPLRQEGDHLISETGNVKYPIRDGVPILLIDEAELPRGIDSLAAFKATHGLDPEAAK